MMFFNSTHGANACRFLSALLLAVLPLNAHALGVDVTTILASESNSVVVDVENPDDSSAHLITLNVVATDSPYNGSELGPANGEVLFSPGRMILSPKQTATVKFIYEGPADDQERYYAIRWQDEVLAQNTSEDEGLEAQVLASARVSTILVVQPRHPIWKYEYDKNTGVLSNTGNISFKAVAYGPCASPNEGSRKNCEESRYVGPGHQTRFTTIDFTKPSAMVSIWKEGSIITLYKS